MFQFLRDRNAEIALLQETHSAPKYEHQWRNEWGGSIFFLHGSTNARGVCILTKTKHFKLSKLSRDNKGRVLCTEFEMGGVMIALCNIMPQMMMNHNFLLISLRLSIKLTVSIVSWGATLTLSLMSI